VGEAATAGRHLGLDLGATNLKWVVVEHDADAWRSLAHDQVRTRAADGPAGIVDQLDWTVPRDIPGPLYDLISQIEGDNTGDMGDGPYYDLIP